MDFTTKKIWVLTDGSQGMVSQVVGLAQHFSEKIQSIETKILFPWSKLKPGIIPIFSWIFLNNLNFSSSPDIVISCGRKSVYLSLYLKKKYKNIITIHIQNPKINFKKFDFIIAPQHDKIKGENIISSMGALHKFTNEKIQEESNLKFNIPKSNLISILIGGTNRHYDFSKKEIEKLISKIQNIKKIYPLYNILLLSSRRTPHKIKRLLRNSLNNIAYIWKDNEENPYIFALKYSKFFIVTADSTSMISECAFTGKPIFIFHLNYKRKSKRIEKFHEDFEKLNITKKLTNKIDLIAWNYNSLNESKRIASIVKERIIKEN